MRVTGIRGTSHPDAYELRRHRRWRQAQRRISALPVRNRPRRKVFPLSLVLLVHGIAVTHPVLDLEVAGIRIGPLYTDSVDPLFFVERDDYPLWMKRIILPRELPRQIRIAFPIRVGIPIVEARIAIELGASVAREPSVR